MAFSAFSSASWDEMNGAFAEENAPPMASFYDDVTYGRSPPEELNINDIQEYGSYSPRSSFRSPLKPKKNEPSRKKNQPQRERYSLQEDHGCDAFQYLHGVRGGRRSSCQGANNGSSNNYNAWEDDYERRDRYVPRQHIGGRDGALVLDNEVTGYDGPEIEMGKRNWGGRRTGGRVTGNVVVR